MANYLKTYELAHNSEFRKRVQTAAVIISRDILHDGKSEEERAGNRQRYTLAQQAGRLDPYIVDRFAWECALNPTIADAETSTPGSAADGDLAFVVSSAWDSVARVA